MKENLYKLVRYVDPLLKAKKRIKRSKVMLVENEQFMVHVYKSS